MSGILTAIQDINGVISNIVWGPIMLVLLIGTGLLLSIRMGFPQFTRFGYVMKNTIGGLFSGKHRTADESGVSPWPPLWPAPSAQAVSPVWPPR